MQTSLIVLHAPAHIRSRLMGLLTVCIGMGPLGILLFGFLADRFGPMLAIDIMANCLASSGWRDRAGVAANDRGSRVGRTEAGLAARGLRLAGRMPGNATCGGPLPCQTSALI